jgi:hypothetical protein
MDKLGVYIYFGVLFLAACYVLFYVLPMFMKELDKHLRRKYFISSLSVAYEANPPEFKHVEILAKAERLNKECQKEAIETLLRKNLKSKESYSKEKIEYFDALIKQIELKEPFEGIADNLKIHLEHLDRTLGDSGYDFRPFTSELRDLAANKIKSRKMNNYIAVISLLVGIVGTGFGVVGHFKNDSSVTSPAIEDKSSNKPIK